MNKQRFRKFDVLNDLKNPQMWVEAFALGKITEATIMAVAKLGNRQDMVEEIYRNSGRLTMTDVTNSRRVRVAAAVSQRPFDMTIPVSAASTPLMVSEDKFILLSDDGKVMRGPGGYKEMKDMRQSGFKLYRLVEVV
jgi:hypothetical protein